MGTGARAAAADVSAAGEHHVLVIDILVMDILVIDILVTGISVIDILGIDMFLPQASTTS